jgi:hypothetical protein
VTVERERVRLRLGEQQIPARETGGSPRFRET